METAMTALLAVRDVSHLANDCINDWTRWRILPL